MAANSRILYIGSSGKGKQMHHLYVKKTFEDAYGINI